MVFAAAEAVGTKTTTATTERVWGAQPLLRVPFLCFAELRPRTASARLATDFAALSAAPPAAFARSVTRPAVLRAGPLRSRALFLAALRFRVAAAFLAEALRCFLVWAMRVLSVGCVNRIIAVLRVRPWTPFDTRPASPSR